MTDTDLRIANYEIKKTAGLLLEAEKLSPGKERTGLLIGAHTTLLWVIRTMSKGYDPQVQLNRDSEKQFQMTLAVFHEYLLDLDSDIEGCTGEELKDIESQIEAARNLRTRVVAHICDGKDARGA